MSRNRFYSVAGMLYALAFSSREVERLNYLPIKIKMPAMSATTPSTIAPRPM